MRSPMTCCRHFIAALGLSVSLVFMPALGKAQEVITGPGFKAHQEDPSYELDFRAPPNYEEAVDLAKRGGLYRAYQLPAPDGRPRSFFTVAFQGKSDEPGLRSLDEFANVNLQLFKGQFPNGIIARVNIQGRVPAKLNALGFPLAMFMFRGNERPGSAQGDALVLQFATPGGFWSIVWTVPQPLMQQGLSVFFEPFIDGITARRRVSQQ